MNYYTYWSISDLPTNSIKSFEVFLWITLLSLILWVIIKRYKKQNGDYEKLILLWTTGIIFLFSFTVFSYLKFFTKETTEERIQNYLKSSHILTVEGLISDFESIKPANRRGRVTIESFVVDSVEFEYDDALLGRFNRFSKTNNRVFKNGLPVKITYGKTKHEILKVEIAR
ncbi:MAG: hypothetical protein ABIP27_05590 [Flavobacterium circumlabens]|uniref:hypothetical protein n=1 Tax=Flavobacterium circumlabens TaxID=2133765 RepID=UPI0032630285